MTTARPRRSTPAASRAVNGSIHGPMRVAAQAADDLLGRGEALAAKALRARVADDPSAEPVLAGEDELEAVAAVWAALGALERGQLPAARATIEALLVRQREDGLLPARLGRRQSLLDRLAEWLGRPVAERPLDQAEYAEDLPGAVRASALVVWAAGEYALRAGDAAFAQRWAVALEVAVGWIDERIGAGLPGVGLEAAYHQAQMVLGHMAIERGDAVAGARRWAAAAAAKGRIQDAERDPAAPLGEVLMAVYVGACDRATAADALKRGSAGTLPGLVALAAAQAGEVERAQQVLEEAASAALAGDGFGSAAEAGCFLRALVEVRRAADAAAQAAKARPKRRQLQLSEDEARILSAC